MGCPWQECFDESTGYPYYWNVNTNAVTWEMPTEYKIALNGATNLIETSQPSGVPIKPNNSVPSTKFLPTSSRNNLTVGLQKIFPNFARDLKKKTTPVPRRAHRKSSDSEDEKIELITSYGEESESDDENSVKTQSLVKHKSAVPKPAALEMPKVPYGSTFIYRIQPEPQVIKPQKADTTEMLDYNLKPPPPQAADIQTLVNKFQRQNQIRKLDEAADVTSIINQLRKQAQLLQDLGGEVSQDVEKLIKPGSAATSTSSSPTPQIDDIIAQIEKEQPPDLQKKNHTKSSTNKPLISLVAGYGDESSDDEDKNSDTESDPVPVKSLFPIIGSENLENTTTLPIIVETPQLQSEISKIGDDSKVQEHPESSENQTNVIEPIAEEFDTKVFKRKRRIALDVLPTKIKKPEAGSFGLDTSISRNGFGFQQSSESATNTTSPPLSSSTSENKYKNGGISFVKAETINLPKDSQEKTSEKTEDAIDGLDDMAALLREKVQFLEDGKNSISPVQVMLIKLDTLLEAREKNGVTNQYLYGWLKETNTELSKLEQEAAPTGWCCQWDRLNKRYFYRNQQTGHIQWEYPAETDIVGGAEAMDICTTPPPPEDDATEQSVALPPLPTAAVEAPPPLPRSTSPKSPSETRANSPKTPPPPQIREKSPSPPPPPRISTVQNDPEVDADRISSPTNGISQPLPPGIDSPSEIAFAVPELCKNFEPKNNADRNSLGSELESFYSDIASLDATSSTTAEVHETNVPNTQESPSTPAVVSEKSTQEVKKKKKKTKLGSGLTLKKKEVSLLVEKWKKVQNDF